MTKGVYSIVRLQAGGLVIRLQISLSAGVYGILLMITTASTQPAKSPKIVTNTEQRQLENISHSKVKIISSPKL